MKVSMLTVCARGEKDNEFAMCRDDTMNLRGKGDEPSSGQDQGEEQGTKRRSHHHRKLRERIDL